MRLYIIFFICCLNIFNTSYAKNLSHLSELAKRSSNAEIEKNCSFGADYMYMFAGSKGDWNTIFRKTHPAGNIYIAYNWDYIQLELGYNWTTRKSKEFALKANNTLFGLTNNQNTLLTGQIRFRSTHLDLNFFANIFGSLDLISAMGCSFTRPHIIIQRSVSSNVADKLLTTQTKTSFVPRFGLGLRYLINEIIGMRIMWNFDKNSRTKLRQSSGFGDKPFKDANTFSIGIFSKI
jgi:hypothetical protein